jgi:ElaB/YqjD/DUF883 family membrane-anchored ribosome-binding protein
MAKKLGKSEKLDLILSELSALKAEVKKLLKQRSVSSASVVKAQARAAAPPSPKTASKRTPAAAKPAKAAAKKPVLVEPAKPQPSVPVASRIA